MGPRRAPGRPPPPGSVPFSQYAPVYLHIKNKQAQVIPFVLNEPQMRVEEEIALAQAEGRPVRFLILKARQLGFSTWSLGRQYEYATSRTGSHCLMAAHDDESGVDLFDRLRLMHDLAPEKPMTRFSNRRELDFSNPDRRQAKENPGLMSKITVGTGGKINLGRSKTLRFLHCSEVAFWPNATSSLLSVEQAIPDDKDTIEIIESTANGVGGEFHERWKRASNPATRGEWRAIFFAWHSFSEYRRPLESGIMAPIPSCVVDHDAFKAEERELVALYGLDDEQLNWRRNAIVSRCGNDMDLFRQEYPSTPEEAFLTTGRPVFNQSKLMYRRRALEARDLRASVDGGKSRIIRGDLIRSAGSVKFIPDPDGPLWIYKLPEGAHEYVIGADVAEGIVKGKDPDACCAQIFDRYSWEQCATFWDHCTPTVLAEKLELLGYWYNTALLAPERNNHGHTVVTILQFRRYPKFHVEQDPDTFGDVPVDKPGWETTAKTRPMLVDALAGAIAGSTCTLNDIATIDECLTFVHNKKNGKAEADAGCHDDRVLGAGIALAVLTWGNKPPQKSSVYDPHRNVDPLVAAASKDVAVHAALLRLRQEADRDR
jgi:hypothetical protein